jgi:hypothetical protein
MIWVIEQLINGTWRYVRYPNSMPMMFDTEAQAQAKLRTLSVGRIYRIRAVRD